MRFRTLKDPDFVVSEIGLGCWAVGRDGGWSDSTDEYSMQTISAAIEEEINFFDVAPVYGFGRAEELLGTVIEGMGVRSDVYIATKCGLVWDDKHCIRRDLAGESIRREIEMSLRRLRTEYVDLYQLHWPDPNTPMDETMETLLRLRKEGKIRAIGLSNFSLPATRTIDSEIGILSFQGLYNMLERNPLSYHGIPLEYRSEFEILPYCREESIGFIPYSPLMQGLLSGAVNSDTEFKTGDVREANPKLREPNRSRYLSAVSRIVTLTANADIAIAHTVIAYLLHDQVIAPVICGAQKPEQIRENAAASGSEISEELVRDIDKIYRETGIADLEKL